MCLVIYKPEGAELPGVKLLKTSWTNNSDGAGFALARGECVEGHKGYLNFHHLWIDLKDKVHKKDTALIHFRLATHGSRGREGTHPFPISSSEEDLKKLVFFSDIAAAHNGIISGFGASYYQGLSDTQHFIKDVLSAPEARKHLYDSDFCELLWHATTSKWAFLFADSRVMLVGNWIEDKETGVCYSNAGYKPKVTTIVKYYNHNKQPGHYGLPYDSYDERDKYNAASDRVPTLGNCPHCKEPYHWERTTCWSCSKCLVCKKDPCICPTLPIVNAVKPLEMED